MRWCPISPWTSRCSSEDLRFLLTKFKRPLVAWHDPNFGVRFDDCLDMIEDAVPPGRIDFIAESSLSLLSEPHLKRLKRNGFKALLPGVESWFELGDKSKTGARQGMDKVRQVAEHVNLILKYIPYVQTNFVLGLDADEGAEPFELTKRFLDLAPGAFPGYSLLTAFGRAAALNLEYQRAQPRAAFPVPFPEQQPGHERQARTLCLAQLGAILGPKQQVVFAGIGFANTLLVRHRFCCFFFYSFLKNQRPSDGHNRKRGQYIGEHKRRNSLRLRNRRLFSILSRSTCFQFSSEALWLFFRSTRRIFSTLGRRDSAFCALHRPSARF